MEFFKLWLEKLKAEGLEMGEEAAKELLGKLFSTAKAAAAETPNGLDDMAVSALSMGEAWLQGLAEKINPKD